MKILYASSLCSDTLFDEIFHLHNSRVQQQSQKFHKLLCKGLSKHVSDILVLSVPPINHEELSQLKNINNLDKNNGLSFHYLLPKFSSKIRYVVMLIYGVFECISWLYRNRYEECVVICDVLNLTVSTSALIASKITRNKCIAIVTDLPSFLNQNSEINKRPLPNVSKKIYTYLCNFFVKKYDIYVFLTEQMNSVVNKKNKPFIVIEGLVDYDMIYFENKLENKYKEKVILYSGALYEKYGVLKLIEAFIGIKNESIRLWIFGAGELENKIKRYIEADDRIRFFGTIKNDELLKIQIKATLLVNPRPSNEKFTLYSFPSKNMEYLVSGTPVLTTKLPGIPKCYDDHFYYFDETSVDTFRNTLECLITLDVVSLHEKGALAKNFVLENKNIYIQARKIVDLVKQSFNVK